jgi:ATP-binding cassette, subfamily B (MDR/TAP), member 1
MYIPKFITLAKGKFAIAALLMLVQGLSLRTRTRTRINTHLHFHLKIHHLAQPLPSQHHPLAQILPRNFTLASLPVLSNISLYLPARELTFIVGSSGSGQSTIAQLLLNLYHPLQGTMLDDSDMRYLDPAWVRENVCVQGMGDVMLERACETVLGGPGCVALSGGQKQRLAIGRARLRNPNVLILGWFLYFSLFID